MKKNRRFGFLEVFLALLIAVVVLGIFALVLAFMYPDATSSITRDVRAATSSGKSPTITFLRSATTRAGNNIDFRIKPVADKIISLFASIGIGPQESVEPPPKDFDANDCIECHENIFEQKGFANISIDHRLHAAQEIKCAKCHVDTKHPNPPSVVKNVCLVCHTKVGASIECDTCHTSGSILSVIPEEKTQEFLQGSIVSAQSILPPGFGKPHPEWLEGKGEAPCQSCHEVPDFCNRCHLVFHNRISDWKQVHGPRLLRQEYVMNVCWTCHAANWCAATCHANQLQRRDSFRALPIIPLERYLEY